MLYILYIEKYVRRIGVVCLLYQLEDINLSKGGKDILRDINIEIAKGDRISVVGPSGSGKSSLLRLLSSLDSPSRGRILYMGHDIEQKEPMEYRKRVRYVFQKPYLFGNTVRDNLTFCYNVVDCEPDYDRIYYLMDRFNMPREFLDKEKDSLSGGEQQRIALVRSLLIEPEVLLLDEVTASLDLANSLLVEEYMIELNEKKGVTTFLVSHDIDQVKRWGGNTIYLEKGKIKHYMAIDELFAEYGEDLDIFDNGEEVDTE